MRIIEEWILYFSDGSNAERAETDDEGIERDSGDSDDDRVSSRSVDFNSIIQVSIILMSTISPGGNFFFY